MVFPTRTNPFPVAKVEVAEIASPPSLVMSTDLSLRKVSILMKCANHKVGAD